MKRIVLVIVVLSISFFANSQTLDNRYAGLYIGMAKSSVIERVVARFKQVYENDEYDVVKYQKKDHHKNIKSTKKRAGFIKKMESDITGLMVASDDWQNVNFYNDYGLHLETVFADDFSVPGFEGLKSDHYCRVDLRFNMGKISEINAAFNVSLDDETNNHPYSSSSAEEFDGVVEDNLGRASRNIYESQTYQCDGYRKVYTISYVIRNNGLRAKLDLHYSPSFRWVYRDAGFGITQAEYCEIVGDAPYLKTFSFVLTAVE